jgi:hypothetical protein
MTMTLHPNNDIDIEDFSIGYWERLLKAGVGIPIDVKPHETEDGVFYFEHRNDVCPLHNDGFKVTEEEALKMADLAESVFSFGECKRFINFCRKSGGFQIW